MTRRANHLVASELDVLKRSYFDTSIGHRPVGITLIMPVHDRLIWSAPALQALGVLSPAPEQIIVVTDVSSGVEDIALLPKGAITVSVPYAIGPAKARNAGAALASTEVLLFVDADVVVPVDTVARVAGEFERHSGLAALFGSYDTAPGDPGFLSQYRNLMHHFVHQSACEQAGTFWAGLGAVKTEVFRSVGGFDASYGVPCIEDIELGGRLRDAGAEILLVKSLQGCHLKRWTAFGMLKTDLLQRGVPWMRLILTRRQLPADLNTGWTSRWSTVLAWSGVVLLPATGYGASWAVFVLAVHATGMVMNLRFYRFLAQQQGTRFAMCSMPWHFVYFLLCGLAGLIGLLQHWRDRAFTHSCQEQYEPGK